MTTKILLPAEIIEKRIYLIRNQKIILDFHLAELYEVDTKILKRSVRRNIDRFPEDFMFEINQEELENLRSHFGTSRWGGIRYAPFAFTEQGVAMLSSVLKSKKAVSVNIEIMRAFVKLRELMLTHKDLARKLESLEKKYDSQFKTVFDAIKQLMTPLHVRKTKIGF